MAALNDNDIRGFAQQLQERREKLRWTIHDALIESRREDYVALAGQVHDSSEESVAELLAGLGLATLDREVDELAAIEAALERVRTGDYGVCTECGQDIGAARLAASPEAERCIGCQTQFESGRRGGRDVTPSL